MTSTEYTLKQLNDLWEQLGNIPVDIDGELIEAKFLDFETGTETLEIWHWFDHKYSKLGTCLGDQI